MKKRMFITTIVMMLVLAVALTTSSLAWFSSQNTTVSASSATFTANTAGGENINLKIADDLGGWSNSIQLTSPAGRTLNPMIPTAALVSDITVGEDIVTTGVTKLDGTGAEVPVAVTHKGYAWPARMTFNAAKINSSTAKFVVDDTNTVTTYGGNARNTADGYYYDYFYILNADQESALRQLTFTVEANLSTIAEGTSGYNAGDYTARGYVAMIVYDQVHYSLGDTIPANSYDHAGKTIVAYDTVAPTAAQLPETAEGVGYDCWIPFCAFTFCTDKANTDTFKEADWQFAELSADYNNVLITSLKTQQYDSLTGTGADLGFKLNTTSLRALNNKVINTTSTTDQEGNIPDNTKRGNVKNSGDGFVRTAETDLDNASEFIMQPGEIFMVSMYYWLDGQSLTEFTDTTVSEISLAIEAARVAD